MKLISTPSFPPPSFLGALAFSPLIWTLVVLSPIVLCAPHAVAQQPPPTAPYPEFAVSSISPPSVGMGGATSLTISGSNFFAFDGWADGLSISVLGGVPCPLNVLASSTFQLVCSYVTAPPSSDAGLPYAQDATLLWDVSILHTSFSTVKKMTLSFSSSATPQILSLGPSDVRPGAEVVFRVAGIQTSEAPSTVDVDYTSLMLSSAVRCFRDSSVLVPPPVPINVSSVGATQTPYLSRTDSCTIVDAPEVISGFYNFTIANKLGTFGSIHSATGCNVRRPLPHYTRVIKDGSRIAATFATSYTHHILPIVERISPSQISAAALDPLGFVNVRLTVYGKGFDYAEMANNRVIIGASGKGILCEVVDVQPGVLQCETRSTAIGLNASLAATNNTFSPTMANVRDLAAGDGSFVGPVGLAEQMAVHNGSGGTVIAPVGSVDYFSLEQLRSLIAAGSSDLAYPASPAVLDGLRYRFGESSISFETQDGVTPTLGSSQVPPSTDAAVDRRASVLSALGDPFSDARVSSIPAAVGVVKRSAVKRLTGFFVPEVTAKYSFSCNSYDAMFAQLKLSATAAEWTLLCEAERQEEGRGGADYFTATTTSIPIALNAGTAYPIDIVASGLAASNRSAAHQRRSYYTNPVSRLSMSHTLNSSSSLLPSTLLSSGWSFANPTPLQTFSTRNLQLLVRTRASSSPSLRTSPFLFSFNGTQISVPGVAAGSPCGSVSISSRMAGFADTVAVSEAAFDVVGNTTCEYILRFSWLLPKVAVTIYGVEFYKMFSANSFDWYYDTIPARLLRTRVPQGSSSLTMLAGGAVPVPITVMVKGYPAALSFPEATSQTTQTLLQSKFTDSHHSVPTAPPTIYSLPVSSLPPVSLIRVEPLLVGTSGAQSARTITIFGANLSPNISVAVVRPRGPYASSAKYLCSNVTMRDATGASITCVLPSQIRAGWHQLHLDAQGAGLLPAFPSRFLASVASEMPSNITAPGGGPAVIGRDYPLVIRKNFTLSYVQPSTVSVRGGMLVTITGVSFPHGTPLFQLQHQIGRISPTAANNTDTNKTAMKISIGSWQLPCVPQHISDTILLCNSPNGSLQSPNFRANSASESAFTITATFDEQYAGQLSSQSSLTSPLVGAASPMAGLLLNNPSLYPPSAYPTSFGSYGEVASVSLKLSNALLPIITFSNSTIGYGAAVEVLHLQVRNFIAGSSEVRLCRRDEGFGPAAASANPKVSVLRATQCSLCPILASISTYSGGGDQTVFCQRPRVSEGQYVIQPFDPKRGRGESAIVFTSLFSILSVSRHSLSARGGGIVTVSGYGITAVVVPNSDNITFPSLLLLATSIASPLVTSPCQMITPPSSFFMTSPPAVPSNATTNANGTLPWWPPSTIQCRMDELPAEMLITNNNVVLRAVSPDLAVASLCGSAFASTNVVNDCTLNVLKGADTATGDRFPTVVGVLPLRANPATITVSGLNILPTDDIRIYVGERRCEIQMGTFSETGESSIFICSVDNLGASVDTYSRVSVEVVPFGFLTSSSPLYASTIFDFSYTLRITGVSVTSGSVGGGTILTLTGSGFNPNASEVWIGGRDSGGVQCVVLSQLSDIASLVCLTSSTGGNVQVRGAITVYVGSNSSTLVQNKEEVLFTFVPVTPEVTSASPQTGSPGASLRIFVTALDANATYTALVGDQELLDVTTSAPGVNPPWIQGSVPVLFPVTTAPITVRSPALQGNMRTRGTITFTRAPTITSISPSTVPFGGGSDITIVGPAFLPANESTTGALASASGIKVSVTVCGTLCPLLSANSTTVICRTPPLVNADLLTSSHLQKDLFTNLASTTSVSPVLFGQEVGSDSLSASLTDGSTSTGVILTQAFSGSALGFGVSLGSFTGAYLTSFQFFPAPGYESLFTSANVETSPDGVTWTRVAPVLNVQPGWNSVLFQTSANVIYTKNIRIAVAAYKVTSTLIVAMQELRVTGLSGAAGSSAKCSTIISISNPIGSSVDTCTTNRQACTAVTGSVVLTYTQTSVPVVTGIEPPSATISGGVSITLFGTFPAASINTADILLDGASCSLLTRSSTSVVCQLAARPASGDRTTRVTFPGVGAALIQATVLFRFGYRWSDPRAWGLLGAVPSGTSGTVTIPANTTVILDVSPSELGDLVIRGRLVAMEKFDGVSQYSLTCRRIIVPTGGEFLVGSSSAAFRKKFTITLTGSTDDALTSSSTSSFLGTSVIGAVGGSIMLYGVGSSSYTALLAATAPSGSSTLSVASALSWSSGDTLVIGSTSFDQSESEVVTLESVVIDSSSGTSMTILTLTSPLQYDHLAGTDTSFDGSSSVDISATIALLSRNIVIRGDDRMRSGGDAVACAVVSSPDPLPNGDNSESTLVLSNVHLIGCGQQSTTLKSPVTALRSRASGKVLISGVSVRQSLNRAVHFEDIERGTIENVVVVDTAGHGIAVEGHSFGNRIAGSAVFNSRPAPARDPLAASYYLAHPSAIVVDNVAGGSSHIGFWFNFEPVSVRGVVVDCPQSAPLLFFFNNRARANNIGLLVDPAHAARKFECGELNATSNPGQATTLTTFIACNNRVAGASLSAVGDYVFDTSQFIDSGDCHVDARNLVTGTTLTLQNSLFVSHRNTTFVPRSASSMDEVVLATVVPFPESILTGVVAVRAPTASGLILTSCKFARYNTSFLYTYANTSSSSPAFLPVPHSILATCSRCAEVPEIGGYVSFVSGLTLEDSDSLWRLGWPYNDRILDGDGSLFGFTATVNATILALYPHLSGPAMLPPCVLMNASASTISAVPTTTSSTTTAPPSIGGFMVCNSSITFHTIVMSKPANASSLLLNQSGFDWDSSSGSALVTSNALYPELRTAWPFVVSSSLPWLKGFTMTIPTGQLYDTVGNLPRDLAYFAHNRSAGCTQLCVANNVPPLAFAYRSQLLASPASNSSLGVFPKAVVYVLPQSNIVAPSRVGLPTPTSTNSGGNDTMFINPYYPYIDVSFSYGAVDGVVRVDAFSQGLSYPRDALPAIAIQPIGSDPIPTRYETATSVDLVYTTAAVASSPLNISDANVTHAYFNATSHEYLLRVSPAEMPAATISESSVGVAPGRAFLIAPVPCAATGCIQFGSPQTGSFNWTDERAWQFSGSLGSRLPSASTSLPEDGDNVTIFDGVTVTLFGDTPRLHTLVIQGTLLLDPASATSITAHFLVILGGRLIAGNSTNPVLATATIHLIHNESVLPIGLGEGLVIASGALINAGYISLVGAPNRADNGTLFNGGGVGFGPGATTGTQVGEILSWSEMATGIEAGWTSLRVSDPVRWKAGDEIAISSSFTNYSLSESFFISSAQDDRAFTLSETAQFEHLSVSVSLGVETKLTSKVALLTRNVRIDGGPNTKEMPSTTTTTPISSALHASSVKRPCQVVFVQLTKGLRFAGFGALSNVEIDGCGKDEVPSHQWRVQNASSIGLPQTTQQGFDAGRFSLTDLHSAKQILLNVSQSGFPAITILGVRQHAASTSSMNEVSGVLITKCAIHSTANTALALVGSENVSVVNSAIVGTRGSSVQVDGDSIGNTFTDVLVFGTEFPTYIRGNATTWGAVNTLCSFEAYASLNVFQGCTAAGSASEGFCVQLPACDVGSSSSFSDNEAHSNVIGFFFAAEPSAGIVATYDTEGASSCVGAIGLRAWKNSYAGIVSFASGNLTLSAPIVHDNHIGVALGKLGSGANFIEGGLIGGRSEVFAVPDCDEHQCRDTNLFSAFDRTIPKCRSVNDLDNRLTRTFNQAEIGVLLMPFLKGSAPTPAYSRLPSSLPVTAPRLRDRSASFGSLSISDAIFANFQYGRDTGLCDGATAIATDGLSTLPLVPVLLQRSTLVRISQEGRLYTHTPYSGWANNINMCDGEICDALSHVSVSDVNGTFFNIAGQPVSVVSSLTNQFPAGCANDNTWNAMLCVGALFGQLTLQSQDEDALTRPLEKLIVQQHAFLSREVTTFPPPDCTRMEGCDRGSGTRPGMFSTTIAVGYDHLVDLGAEMPFVTTWQFVGCPAGQGVVLRIGFGESVVGNGVSVWDLSTLQAASTKGSSLVVGVDAPGTHYVEKRDSRLYVVLPCDSHIRVHLAVEARIGITLSVPIEAYVALYNSTAASRVAAFLGVVPSRVRQVSIYPGSTVAVFAISVKDSVDYNATVAAAAINRLVMQLAGTGYDILTERLGMPVSGIDHIVWASSTAAPYAPPSVVVEVSVALIATIVVIATGALIGLAFGQFRLYRYFAAQIAADMHAKAKQKKKNKKNKTKKRSEGEDEGENNQEDGEEGALDADDEDPTHAAWDPTSSVQREVIFHQEQKCLDRVRVAQSEAGLQGDLLAPVEQVYAASQVTLENEAEYFGLTGAAERSMAERHNVDISKVIRKIMVERHDNGEELDDDDNSSAELAGEGDVWSTKRIERRRQQPTSLQKHASLRRRQSSVHGPRRQPSLVAAAAGTASAAVRTGERTLLQMQAAQLMQNSDHIPTLASSTPSGTVDGGSSFKIGSPSHAATSTRYHTTPAPNVFTPTNATSK